MGIRCAFSLRETEGAGAVERAREERVPESAASMLNPNPEEEGVENLGGSTRVNGEPAVFLRFKIPMRFRVGERPAGAERGAVFVTEVFTRGAGERAERIGRRGEVGVLFREEKSLGDGGALVRKKLTGLTKVEGSFEDPSCALERLGER